MVSCGLVRNLLLLRKPILHAAKLLNKTNDYRISNDSPEDLFRSPIAAGVWIPSASSQAGIV